MHSQNAALAGGVLGKRKKKVYEKVYGKSSREDLVI